VRRLRLGMVGGGQGALIGTVHRMAARLDDRYELVAGALSSDAARAHASAAALYIAPDRSYDDFRSMARAEAGRLDVVSIVTPNHVHAAAAMAFLDAGIHVMCDKPLTHTLEAAEELAASVARSGCLFGLTHNYTGYPMVRQAREMVAAGALGAVRVVQVEYSQGWLATNLEASGQKQAAWRTDPARSGAGGALGDIGTHAFNLAEFVTGLRVERLAADLSSFVAGRRVDDNAHILLRFAGGAKGMLFASQVAVGCDNALKLRIFGEKGSLTWQQEGPETLTWGRLGEAPTMLTRGGPGLGDAAAHATRLPGGHPEGYLEGFAQIYSDMAEQISARIEGRVADPRCLLVPGIAEGLRGMRFIAGAVASSGADAGWVSLG
jgi:predicted dehydrogenase